MDFLQNITVDQISILSVVILLLYVAILSHKQTTAAKSIISQEIQRTIDESTEKIKNAVSPRVTFCSTIFQVRTDAAKLISTASDKYDDLASKKRLNNSENEGEELLDDPSKHFITIYGSASLGNESEAGIGFSDEERQESMKDYKAAMAKAAKSGIRFRRYCALIAVPELGGRSKYIQNEYLNWLKNQIELIETDSNYTLIVSPRAPQWGTSSTTFITNEGVIEVKGHGQSAMAVRDTKIALSLRSALKTDIDGAMPTNNREVHRGAKDDLAWLKEQLPTSKSKKKP